MSGDTEENDQKRDEEFESQVKRLQVPRDALQGFLDRLRGDLKCSFCTTGTYEVAPAPSGGTAGMLSCPVPHIKGLGAWFYSASCSDCGNTQFFLANRARRLMSEPH